MTRFAVDRSLKKDDANQLCRCGDIGYYAETVTPFLMCVFFSLSLFAQNAASTSGSQDVVDTTSIPVIENVDAVDEPIAPLTAAETPWGTFKIGSRIHTRTTTTTYHEKAAQSVSESTITLEAIEEQGILLKQTDSVEIGGKKVQGEPQNRKLDFYQQSAAGGTVQNLPSEKIQIGQRVILCGVRVYEYATPQAKRRTKIWYNPKIAPYVLCTETTKTSVVTAEQPTEKLLGRVTSVVLNPPSTTLRGSFFGTYRVQTVKQNTDGTIYSLADCSLQVPGWIKGEESWEYDRENNLIRTQSMTSTQIVVNPKVPQNQDAKAVETEAFRTSRPSRQ